MCSFTSFDETRDPPSLTPLRLGAMLIFLSIAAGQAFAAPLDLAEAVRLAEQQAPMIQAREAALTSAERAVGPAGELPDPQLTFGIDSLPVNTRDAFSLTRDSFTERTVGVMQEFPRREKRRLRSERAGAVAAREEALLETERLSTRESVARAWIARLAATRRLELLESLRPRVESQAIAATAAISAGRASAADGIGAEAAKALLEDRIIQARRELADAEADFARWLPEASDRPLGDAPDWNDLGRNADTLLSDVEHHRELLTYAAAERAAETDVALAQADKRPDWAVELSYAQRGPQYSNFISLEFRVDLPLFAARRQDPLIASRQAALAQVQAEREAARRMHAAELSKTLAAWRSARERVRGYERALLPLADDRAEAALAAYRGGRMDLQASIAALNDAIEQRLAYTSLLNELGQSWAALHFAFAEER